jgi:hypothetical protein
MQTNALRLQSHGYNHTHKDDHKNKATTGGTQCKTPKHKPTRERLKRQHQNLEYQSTLKMIVMLKKSIPKKQLAIVVKLKKVAKKH